MMVCYCEFCNIVEQERPKTVFKRKKQTPKQYPKKHAELWPGFALTKIGEFKSQQERSCFIRKRFGKRPPSNACRVAERCVVVEGVHIVKMGKEGIVSPVCWISDCWSKQHTQRFVKDIKTLSAGL